jgi:hypothetical protein
MLVEVGEVLYQTEVMVDPVEVLQVLLMGQLVQPQPLILVEVEVVVGIIVVVRVEPEGLDS